MAAATNQSGQAKPGGGRTDSRPLRENGGGNDPVRSRDRQPTLRRRREAATGVRPGKRRHETRRAGGERRRRARAHQQGGEESLVAAGGPRRGGRARCGRGSTAAVVSVMSC